MGRAVAVTRLRLSQVSAKAVSLWRFVLKLRNCSGGSVLTMAFEQIGPSVTDFVTGVKTVYRNYTLMLLLTPPAANTTIGQGGF